jgi:hypothetical protein
MKRPSDILNHSPDPTRQTTSVDNPNSVTRINVSALRGRLPESPIHQVTDQELDSMVNGSPESWNFSLGVALLSISIGIVGPLVSSPMPHPLQLIFTGVAAGFAGAGASFLIVWFRMRRATLKLAEKIRDRLD